MAAKITISSLIAVFGTEDKTPITITRDERRVTASRDDLTIQAPVADVAVAPSIGVFHGVFSEENTLVLTEQPKKMQAQRQTPAFDKL